LAAAKFRVDKLLVEKELVESREQAQRLVMAGFVFANGQKMVKPAQLVKPDVELEVRGAKHPYVSRGGLKLEGALDAFQINLEGLNCLDLGSSTGGFTDLMLQRGATSVTSVDVGKGQLHWKLRQDDRVRVMEKTNARYLQPGDFPEPFDFLTGDLSFIGLHLILPAAFPLARDGGQAVFLVKPQFEAGRSQVGKGGVVRDPEVHREVLLRVLGHDYSQGRLALAGIMASPLKGPAGNIEYLAHFRGGSSASEFRLEESVERALEKVYSQVSARE
jgi:23S rRNA (cytidine1920-2'-O)/16S rRNA (cytidine1409-2'-O)-methyltransferase